MLEGWRKGWSRQLDNNNSFSPPLFCLSPSCFNPLSKHLPQGSLTHTQTFLKSSFHHQFTVKRISALKVFDRKTWEFCCVICRYLEIYWHLPQQVGSGWNEGEKVKTEFFTKSYENIWILRCFSKTLFWKVSKPSRSSPNKLLVGVTSQK